MSRVRLDDIDRAKGLAIILVVLGHVVARNPPPDHMWWTTFKNCIYLFHMPFFMFLSGLIMYYSYRPIESMQDYVKYISKKFMRLMPAFILFGVVILIGKVVCSHFMYVDRVPDDLLEQFMYLLIIPAKSYSFMLWYIYVLFIFYLLMPGFLFIVRKRVELLLIIGACIHFISLPRLFALNQVGEYFFIFSLGMFVSLHLNTYLVFINKYFFLFVGLFVVSFLMISVPEYGNVNKLITGLLSVPVLHMLVRSGLLVNSKILALCGKYTFSIYILNTIVIGFTKGIILKFTSWGGVNFYWVVILLFITGITVPILIKQKIFSKILWLDAITE
jgi:fucose 4-O-acetylase-like acetyltransferase